MTISRMQQPRQLYGLGSFVKSIGKGIKGAVKGITGAVKDNPLLAVAALNFAPMLAGAKPFIGMGSLTGSVGTIPGITSLFGKEAGEKTLGKTLGVFAGGSLLGGLLSQAEETGDPEGITRDVGALRTKLTEAYRNQRTFADEENEEAAIANQVEIDLSEYNKDMARGLFAMGGRIGYAEGNPDQKQMAMVEDMLKRGMDMSTIKSITGASDKMIQDRINFIKYGGAKVPVEKANGGRIGYAFGDSAEDNAIQASGIMGLPLNQNPAGITELDLRETGGFIPPVGVKEKADDIPAMLSNNEFVFTADAVRGMGDGNVNKGAQRLYDQMKMLEKGGRV